MVVNLLLLISEHPKNKRQSNYTSQKLMIFDEPENINFPVFSVWWRIVFLIFVLFLFF
jgi:hypothetical protein